MNFLNFSHKETEILSFSIVKSQAQKMKMQLEAANVIHVSQKNDKGIRRQVKEYREGENVLM